MNMYVPGLTNYELNELIHQSDRALVYRGRKTNDGQPAVIKLMQREYPTFNELVQFRNQYAIAKNLDVEGIVKPYALERYENRYALIMEDFGGISLDEYYQNSSPSIPEFLSLGIQLSQILHQLHQNRVIHKDIKPANILIHPETQEVKLIDFSISSLLPKETATLQTPNVLEGTLAYISPEQTGRMNRGIDYRSDFYSLGVTFYQLLNGNLPFETNDALELVHCHIAKMPAALGKRQKAIGNRGEDIPGVLSDIVLKLMAKNAEDRYQSALGLKYDLEKCLVRWEEKGSIEAFELGERDLSDRFLIPEKLYGRETEVQTLLNAFDRVSKGNSELLLVAGYSGVGKTAVVNEAHKPITEKRGYFIKGKFDQFMRNIPLSAFVQAFRDLMRQLLAESDAQLENWKSQILDVAGKNGRLLIDVIPELERIIGSQPPTQELQGAAAQNRFNLLFQKFVRVFATPQHPLTIFLDDLQWADLASLNLLKLFAAESQNGYLLLLGAYRDNEVFPAHPLLLTLSEIEKRNGKIQKLTLAPLNEINVNRFVADTLLCSIEIAAPLSKLVYQKTKGNPFFTTQFLKELYADNWILFDTEAGYWQCDLTRVRKLALTDDVVQFMAGRLHKLSVATQFVLKLAACIGNQFDLATLAVACEESQEQVAADLWPALQEDFIIPESQTYKFFQGEDSEVSDLETVTVAYRFLHDRVQQAAYSLIPDAAKQQVHLKLGRLLWQSIAPEDLNDRIFALVNPLNLGAALIADARERIQLAELNLKAGCKAKAATAYDTALEYLETGRNLLPSDAWQQQYDLTLQLYAKAVEVEYLLGNLDKAKARSEVVLKEARSLLDKVKIYELKVQFFIAQNQMIEAIEIALPVLELLGYPLKTDPAQLQLVRPLPELAELEGYPATSDRQKLAVLQLLTILTGPAYQARPDLLPFIVFKMVNLSLEFGHSSLAAYAYGMYGLMLCGPLNDIALGYRAGLVSLKVLEQYPSDELKCKVNMLFDSFTRHWKEPHIETIAALDNTVQIGMETGDLVYAAYCAMWCCGYMMLAGMSLPELGERQLTYIDFLATNKQEHALYPAKTWRQLTQNLCDEAPDPLQLAGDYLSRADVAHLEAAQNQMLLFFVCFAEVILAYFLEDWETAKAKLALATVYHPSASASMLSGGFIFYATLVDFINYADEDCEQWESIRTNIGRLANYASHAPHNYQSKYLLVLAEEARIQGNVVEAIDFYDRAIAEAKENGYIQEEALANELAAKFYLDWGKEKFAALYMQEAYYCYACWGAKAKVNDLEQRYPQLLTPILQSDRPSKNPGLTISKLTSVTHTSTMSNVSTILDFSSLLKASQTLSGEIELDRLLSTLMKIILENAGATKGALLLVGETGLTVEAIATRSDAQQDLKLDSLHQSIPLETYKNLPAGLINYVRRLVKTTLLDGKTAQTQFAADNYLLRFSPQSLLCMPLLERRNLIGILYLENSLTADAFTSDRLELLNAICAQAAISLTNARLYQQAQQALKDLQDAQLQLVQNEKMATLGNLVAGVAHEINNPLTFISGNVEISQDYLEDISSILKRYRQEYSNPSKELTEEIEERDLDFVLEDFPQVIASMEMGVKRIRNISISLRTFSRTDTNVKTELNLRDGLESTLLILKYRLKANEERPAIQAVTNYGDVPPIQCYPGQLNQVFMNLLANSIDAIEEGNAGRSYDEIKANPNCISIKTYRDEQNAVIKIADNGRGMSEEVKAKIFDQGFTTKGVGKGTGLGMAISYQIVAEKHGGTIACTSELGVGTEFTISLPLS